MSAAVEAGGAGGLTLGDVVRAALPHFTQSHRLPVHHAKVLRAIAACRTSALGGHQYTCTSCGCDHFVPHSCRNRHCPTCQGINGAEWLEKQVGELLPIPYFHLVFTLPHELNSLIAHNQRELYNLLFASASATLLQFGRQPPWSRDRDYRRLAYVGPNLDGPLSPALRGDRRRDGLGRHRLGPSGSPVSLSGTGPLGGLPRQILCRIAGPL